MTVRIVIIGDASVGARGVRLYQDSDGDSLSDYRERQRWTIPYGYGDSFIPGKGWTLIKVGPKGKNPIAEWVFSTILASDKPDGFFDSKDDALDNLDDRHDDPGRIDDTPEC